MRTLAVLFDARCDFCVRCSHWLSRQPAYVRLDFLPADPGIVATRFPTLSLPAEPDELLVISDEGAMYRGADAWLICLWALREYRGWSFLLADPSCKPFVRRAFDWFSSHRHAISGAFCAPAPGMSALTRIAARSEPCCGAGPPSWLGGIDSLAAKRAQRTTSPTA